MKKDDEKFMMRCLDLARHGLGTTYPNPLVGSVIVHKGKVIAEDFHRKSGGPHAESLAIAAVKDRSLLRDATLYVNLEPCSHYGKTPPCAGLIVSYGIPRVVIGTKDTSTKVAGKGIALLRDGGCEVVTGILEKESRRINRRFFTWNEKKRPYIILKWAESADGYTDKIRKEGEPIGPNWISGPLGRQLVHKWRSEEQAVLVGRRTARIDNPLLTVRDWEGTNPMRIVIDRELSLPQNLNLFNNDATTVVFNAVKNETKGVHEYVKLDFSKEIINDILAWLYKHDIQSLIVEGGADTINRFVNADLWDEARVLSAEKYFQKGVKAPHIPNTPEKVEYLPDTVYKLFFNREKDAYL